MQINWPSFLDTCRYEANQPRWDNRPGVELWCAKNHHSEIDRDLEEQNLDEYLWWRLSSANLATFFYLKPALFAECPQEELEKIEGSDWSWLLQRVPECANRCDWSKLTGKDWASLLSKQPQFADKCVLIGGKKTDDQDCAAQLSKQPPFNDKSECVWDKSDDQDWETLLSEHPQFAETCDWSKLDEHDWDKILGTRPEFAVHFDWRTLGIEKTKWLLDRHLSLAEQGNMRSFCQDLPGDDLYWLLLRVPGVAGRCNWNSLNKKQAKQLLVYHPSLAKECRKWRLWNTLHGDDWVELLLQQQDLANQCDWGKLTGKNWADLLCEHQEFAEKCKPYWRELDGDDWATLLIAQPQFADKCDWGKLTGKNWADLLCKHQEFAEKCNWEKLKWSHVKQLLLGNRFLEVQCHDNWHGWEQLEDGGEWGWLLLQNPFFADKCNYWGNLSWPQVQQLLDKQSSLAKYCLKCQCWNQLDGNEWVWLLRKLPLPEFADICAQHLNDLKVTELNKMLSDLHIFNASLEARLAAKLNAQKKTELDQFRQRAAARAEALRDFYIPPPKQALHNAPEPYYE